MKLFLPLALWVQIVSSSCSPQYNVAAGTYPPPNRDTIDYGDLSFWAAHPAKHDPSDSVPAPLMAGYFTDTAIDVFFIHPTTYTQLADPGWNAPVDDAVLNARTDNTTILFQASAFNEYRVFAPRYRQAHVRAYFTADTTSALKAFDVAYSDVKNAFLYYLAHFNNGHPFIIASHSQGSTHALRLLKEVCALDSIRSKIIVAYLVGMYIAPEFSSTLPVCRDSLQTNCVCGWRTFKSGYVPDFVLKEKDVCLVTNPLSWTTDTIAVSKQMNRGAILKNFNKVYRAAAAARIHRGVLWTERPSFPGSFLLRTKNYHIGDINLYYMNIRENLRSRVAEYRKKIS